MAEIEEATVTIPHSDPPQVDVVKLVELLLISKPPTTEVSPVSSCGLLCHSVCQTLSSSMVRIDHLLQSMEDVILYYTIQYIVCMYVCTQ